MPARIRAACREPFWSISLRTVFYSRFAWQCLLWLDHYRRNAGAAAGMIGGIASLVGAGVAPAIFGYLLDHFAAGTVFGAAAFVTLIGLGALILAARKALPRL